MGDGPAFVCAQWKRRVQPPLCSSTARPLGEIGCVLAELFLVRSPAASHSPGTSPQQGLHSHNSNCPVLTEPLPPLQRRRPKTLSEVAAGGADRQRLARLCSQRLSALR